MYCSRAGGGTVTDISALLFGLNFVFLYLLPGDLLDPAGHLSFTARMLIVIVDVSLHWLVRKGGRREEVDGREGGKNRYFTDNLETSIHWTGLLD